MQNMISDTVKKKGPVFINWLELFQKVIIEYYSAARLQSKLSIDSDVPEPTITHLKNGSRGCNFETQKALSYAILKDHPNDSDCVLLVERLYTGQLQKKKSARASPPSQQAIDALIDQKCDELKADLKVTVGQMLNPTVELAEVPGKQKRDAVK